MEWHPKCVKQLKKDFMFVIYINTQLTLYLDLGLQLYCVMLFERAFIMKKSWATTWRQGYKSFIR